MPVSEMQSSPGGSTVIPTAPDGVYFIAFESSWSIMTESHF